ncbi:MAG: hypothetical protein ACRD8A_17930 [Candidatus Acidiferrales bacterium]
MRNILPSPGRPGASRSSGSHATIAPNRRWNGVRVNDFHNLNQANSSASGIRNRRAENEVGFGGAPVDLQQLLNISPTDGFNWQYVNSINRDLPLKAIVDPVTQLEIAQAERLLRNGSGQFSGAYILGGGYGYYMPEEAAETAPASAEQMQTVGEESAERTQPRVIVLQQKAAVTSQVQESAPPTMPDQGPLTLVLRDGEKIQAIAFTFAEAKIVYITPDGTRKTIDAAQLDSAATVRLNQENGTPLQLPSSLGNS